MPNSPLPPGQRRWEEGEAHDIKLLNLINKSMNRVPFESYHLTQGKLHYLAPLGYVPHEGSATLQGHGKLYLIDVLDILWTQRQWPHGWRKLQRAWRDNIKNSLFFYLGCKVRRLSMFCGRQHHGCSLVAGRAILKAVHARLEKSKMECKLPKWDQWPKNFTYEISRSRVKIYISSSTLYFDYYNSFH